MRHINIPIFIPHLGCPNDCVFCNQRSISGHGDFDISTVTKEIEDVLSTCSEGDECEIAFFGGSFTGIDRDLMVSLLDIAESYICGNGRRVSSIRLSTRPDYIDEEILDILSRYSVKTVELGLQSMDDEVLMASRRGHDAACAVRAARLIKERGFSLVGQMMIGLPKSTLEKELYTARKICEIGADGARIYPTVVFYDTELCRMAEVGEYSPITNEEAVLRSAAVLDIFEKNKVNCIRIGLCSSDNLSSDEKVYGGASHAALGELVMSELYFMRICEKIEADFGVENADFSGKILTVFAKKGDISKVVGQNKKNKLKLCQKYGFKDVKVLEKNDILSYNVYISF
ncbi:MAG: radical SAM protein [Clostridia bacterium]|nr:radical SAM protein [Clostridia bacterium]